MIESLAPPFARPNSWPLKIDADETFSVCPSQSISLCLFTFCLLIESKTGEGRWIAVSHRRNKVNTNEPRNMIV